MRKLEIRYTDLNECVIGRQAVIKTWGDWWRTPIVVSLADQLQNGPVFETAHAVYLPHPDYKP